MTDEFVLGKGFLVGQILFAKIALLPIQHCKFEVICKNEKLFINCEDKKARRGKNEVP